MIPKLEGVEMCLDRSMMDPDFNGYKLSLDTLPVRKGASLANPFYFIKRPFLFEGFRTP